ncbi:ABC transporter permease [Paenibacillus psychroresistens]|nr:ABC transporter permease subunit [Paenibacillus psychroresistens]
MRKNTRSGVAYNTKFSSIYILYLFLIPAIGLTFFFNYIPMFSNVIAFMDYDFTEGWMGMGSPFVGFKHFAFLQESWFYELAIRTITYSFFILITSFPLALIFALLINELKSSKFKKITQTVSYIPHFVSWVTVSGLVYIFLTVDPSGLLNNLKVLIFGGERISYMQDSGYFLPLLILTQIWKETGWGCIIYLAALTTIDPSLYEAAVVDGATRWQKVWYITLPALIPTTAILLIFSLVGLFSSNFDQIFNLQNSVIRQTTDTINIYTFYVGVRSQQYSLAAAVGLFQGVVTFILVMISNYTSKKMSGSGII